MGHPGMMANVRVDADRTHQFIEGFGVNINAKCWQAGRLAPLVDLLIDDLGVTHFRVDIWGKSNWIDPDNSLGPTSLFEVNLAAIYQGNVFQDGFGLMRHLNRRGIQPYLACSGDVPGWMLGQDGKTLVDFEAFSSMLVSLVDWARRRENIHFNLLGPLNETDIGSPEGPTLAPQGFVQVCELLVEKLRERGWGDIRLVVPEQAHFDEKYLQVLTASSKLRGKIAAFGMHDYADYDSERYAQVVNTVRASAYADVPLWMTEYGDLDQSGEREWYVAWAMTSRLLDQLTAGFSAALVWDAFDNYHDHDEAWTIYGLIRTGLRAYTPKKRYYAQKQVFRHVRPGFVRLAVTCEPRELRLLAFASPDRRQLTLVGMNTGCEPLRANIQLSGFPPELMEARAAYHRTTESENCHCIGSIPMRGGNWPFTGLDVDIPPACIFTITTSA